MSEQKQEAKSVISEERARAVLREYPDADLSGFEIEGGADADVLAIQEVVRAVLDIDAMASRMRSMVAAHAPRSAESSPDGREVM